MLRRKYSGFRGVPVLLGCLLRRGIAPSAILNQVNAYVEAAAVLACIGVHWLALTLSNAPGCALGITPPSIRPLARAASQLGSRCVHGSLVVGHDRGQHIEHQAHQENAP
jgi:hypothetical protein